MLNPDAYWHRCRGDFYREMADYDKAIADYTEAIRLAHYIELKLKGTYEGKLRGTNRRLLAYRNRGRAYLFKDDYDQAIADFTEAIQIDPEFSAAHFARGDAYRKKGDYDQAIADFTEAIQIDPEFSAAHCPRRCLS